MKEYQTVTQGRSRRANAGNRMQELLEKARQEDQEKDELFAEEADDGEFEEPTAQRDVFLDEFADTDEEVDSDEDEDSRLRREERAKKKGKGVFNPFVKIRSGTGPSVPQPSAAELASLDPSIDVSKMAPSTLVLELRKQRREAKRLHRSEARRSNLRASTLRTEQDVIEREKQEKIALKASRKGRKAQHETGEVRGARPMTQAELIAAALEEEERNKEALTQWLRREEEKRELRRVGRKVVRGPRLTFVSRTVGKLIEVVDESRTGAEATPAEEPREPRGPAEVPVPKDVGQDDPKPAGEAVPDTEAQTNDKDVSAAKMDIDEPTSSAKKQADKATLAGPAAEGTASGTNEAPAPDAAPSTADAKAHEAGSSTTAGPAAASDTVSSVPDAPPSASQPEPSKAVESAEQTAAGPSHVPTSKDAASTTTVLVQPMSDTAPGDSSAKADPSSAGPSTDAGPSTQPPSDSQTSVLDKDKVTETRNGAATDSVVDQSKSADTTKGKGKAKATEPDADADPSDQAPSGPYERNYLILNQVPGGLASEVSLILGDHVDWSDVKVIPARNRPINRKPPTDPLTTLPARYRHPASNVPYASAESYATLQALLDNRYVWTEGGWWAGGEADAAAEGVDGPDGIPGWREACMRGWAGGRRLGGEDVNGEGDGGQVDEGDVEMEEAGEDEEEADGEGEGEEEVEEEEGEEVEDEDTKPVIRKGKAALKGKKAAPKKGAKSKTAKRSGGTKRKAEGKAAAPKKKARR